MTTSQAHVAATPERVFAQLVDAESYPEWLGGARHVEVHDPRWPRPDSSFSHEVGVGPVDVRDSSSVADLTPDRRLHLIVRARPFLVADVVFELRPDESGTQVTMTETPRGVYRLFTPLLSPAVKVRNAMSLSRLAALIEERTAR